MKEKKFLTGSEIESIKKDKEKDQQEYLDRRTKQYAGYGDLDFEADKWPYQPKQTIKNYMTFLNSYGLYMGKLKYNEYLQREEYDNDEITDTFYHKMYAVLEEFFGQINRQNADSALLNVIMMHRYNPLIDKLKELKWDGVNRIDSLFIDLLDADDTPLNREMTRKWMIAAIKRTMMPGCKFDNMLVLQGEQGVGKSTICEKLAMGYYNTISLGEVGDKDLIDKLNNTWIAIIDELDTFNRKEMTTIKTFLSQTTDNVRLAYKHRSQTFHRHCVFIGSTNDDTFLRDTTSSVERRFWIIQCNKKTRDDKIIKVMTDEYVNQIWAEAYNSYINDPDQYLDIDIDHMNDFAKAQEKYKTYNTDDFIETVKMVLDDEYHINKDGEVISVDQMDDKYSTTPKYRIKQIPVSILAMYMKAKYKDDRSAKYLKIALAGEWEYKNVRYKSLNNKTLKSWVRKEVVNQEEKEYNPMNAFTEYFATNH